MAISEKMKRLILVFCTLVFLAGCSLKDQNQPNILFIMADDCTYNELGCYGGLNAYTPNIDKLAEEGLTFNRAYVSMSMCTPCRHELYTGLYPLESGCAWNKAQSAPDTKSVFHYLSDLGYSVGLAGKMHTNPPEVFPYQYVQGFEDYCVLPDEKREDVSGIKEFMSANPEKPFCLFVCSTNPHAPWTLGDPSVYPPDQLKLPPSLGDTPAVREAYSRYLAEVTYFDRQVGEILKTLEETGRMENTIIMLSTEQGWQFSGGKWTNWDLGVHTALIVKWPGMVNKGRSTEALVQYADITPTLIDIAGGKRIDYLSGTSFLDVLRAKTDKHRDFVYCMHNNIPEGRPYPIRSIISKDYHLIMNLTPDSIYFEKHIEGGAHGETWWNEWMASGDSIPHNRFLVDRFHNRPALELYSVINDSLEFHNLAGLDEYRKIENYMLDELQGWMADQKDPGVPVDTREAFRKKYWGNN